MNQRRPIVHNDPPGLWLPKGYGPTVQRSPLMVAICAHEIYGKRPTEKELIQILKSVNYADCVLIACKIGVLLEQKGWGNLRTQEWIASPLFDETCRRQVTSLMQGAEQRILFSAWQLRFLIKASLLFGSSAGAKAPSQVFLYAFGRLLLTVNDLMTPETQTPPHGNPKDLRTSLIEDLVRMEAANRRESTKHLLTRYYELYFHYAAARDAKSSRNFIDVRKAFLEATEIDLRMFIALGFGIITRYVGSDVSNASQIVIRPKSFFRRTAVPSRISSKMLPKIAVTRASVKREHQLKYSGGLGSYFDLVFLMLHPLVRLRNRYYVPVTPMDVVERVTSGVYWDIHDYLQGKERQKFQRFFGELLQVYVSKAFQRMYPTDPRLTPRVFFDPKYKTGKQEQRGSDVIVFSPGQAVFLDVTVGRFRMEQTITTGSIDSFRQDIQAKILHTAKELDRSIRDFKSGKLTFLAWRPTDIRQYFPAIVTVSHLPLVLLVYDEVLQMVQAEGLLQDEGVQPLQILCLEDVEFLEALVQSGIPLEQVLREKISDPQYASFPVGYYLTNKDAYRHQLRNDHLSETFAKYAESVRKELFPKSRRVAGSEDSLAATSPTASE